MGRKMLVSNCTERIKCPNDDSRDQHIHSLYSTVLESVILGRVRCVLGGNKNGFSVWSGQDHKSLHVFCIHILVVCEDVFFQSPATQWTNSQTRAIQNENILEHHTFSVFCNFTWIDWTSAMWINLLRYEDFPLILTALIVTVTLYLKPWF